MKNRINQIIGFKLVKSDGTTTCNECLKKIKKGRKILIEVIIKGKRKSVPPKHWPMCQEILEDE